jgi:DNA-binding IclR family transcriptional regulator
VHLAVFGGEKAVVIHREEPAPGGYTPLSLLENAPVHCTSIGKAILAFQPDAVVERIIANGLTRYTDATITDPGRLLDQLAEVRARGYAVDNGEHQPGLRCIGAPIRDQFGRVFASISASASALQSPAEREAGIAQMVIYHADQISQRLGYSAMEAKRA